MGYAIWYFFLNTQILDLSFFTKIYIKIRHGNSVGFKNLSKIRSNSIGSKSVISRAYATNDPAPEPLPGPTGIEFF